MTTIAETKLDINGFAIAALKANTGEQHKIICVHGWLDNANSFRPLLSHINHAQLVAIDLPGHGYSDHQQSVYSLAAQAHTVLAVADALGWDNFSILGHSLGGCIAPFAAAAASHRIENLILIDAAGPQSEPAESLPPRLEKFHNDMSQPDKYKSRLFDSIDQAVDSRLRANKMSPDSARLIIERQLKEVNHNGDIKWQWRFDNKLRFASPSYFTEDQVKAVLAAVKCPTLCILADEGHLADRAETEGRLKCLNNRSVVTLSGYHHLHLDTPQPVANEINQFLTRTQN